MRRLAALRRAFIDIGTEAERLWRAYWVLWIVAAVTVTTIALLIAPQAHAWPTCDGGYLVGSPWGGYCDGIPEVSGQHWHCQWGFGFSQCEWRWPDNTPANNPYV